MSMYSVSFTSLSVTIVTPIINATLVTFRCRGSYEVPTSIPTNICVPYSCSGSYDIS